MTSDREALDILENKIQQLEIKVYGENLERAENSSSIVDMLLQSNIMMTAALSRREKSTLIFKRLQELNNYLEMNPLIEDPVGLNTKLNIILSMQEEFECSIAKMEKIEELKHVLDDDKLKNVQILKNDLDSLLASHLFKKEKLYQITNEITEILIRFNEICLEISKCFFLLNETITKLENTGATKG